MISESVPVSMFLYLSYLPDFLWWGKAIGKCKTNKLFPPQFAPYSWCFIKAIETLTKTCSIRRTADICPPFSGFVRLSSLLFLDSVVINFFFSGSKSKGRSVGWKGFDLLTWTQIAPWWKGGEQRWTESSLPGFVDISSSILIRYFKNPERFWIYSFLPTGYLNIKN